MKREFIEWEKIFANHIFDKELVSKTYTEYIQLSLKTNNLVKIWVEEVNTFFFFFYNKRHADSQQEH